MSDCYMTMTVYQWLLKNTRDHERLQENMSDYEILLESIMKTREY